MTIPGFIANFCGIVLPMARNHFVLMTLLMVWGMWIKGGVLAMGIATVTYARVTRIYSINNIVNIIIASSLHLLHGTSIPLFSQPALYWHSWLVSISAVFSLIIFVSSFASHIHSYFDFCFHYTPPDHINRSVLLQQSTLHLVTNALLIPWPHCCTYLVYSVPFFPQLLVVSY